MLISRCITSCVPNRVGIIFVIFCVFLSIISLGYLHLLQEFEKLSKICLEFGYLHLLQEFEKLSKICLEFASGRPHISVKSHSPQISAEDDIIIIYNRVPKTGSTSFVGVVYDLCEQNHFNVIHLNVSKNNHVLSLSDQIRFVHNITEWTEKKPAFYHGHIAYLNFVRFGVGSTPMYINLVREPLDRLVSYYYFLRHGDDFRPHVKRRKAGDQETFDECVERGGEDCSTDHLWLQIPFFCGHSAECWTVGSEWALQMAKHNLVHNYLVVGVTEQLQDFVAVLEASIPRYFRGALDMFNNGNRSHLRKTFNRLEPAIETIQKIQRSSIWKMENEFYTFAKEQFHYIRQRTINSRGNGPRRKQPNFMFEKIRPR